jgi:membrane-bound lytic murein transglycosylase D
MTKSLLAAMLLVAAALGCASVSAPAPSPDSEPAAPESERSAAPAGPDAVVPEGDEAGPDGSAAVAPRPDGILEPDLPPPAAVRVAGPDPDLTLLVEKINALAAEAISSFDAGERSAAKRRFEESLDLILDSGYDLSSTPMLRDAFEDVVETMNSTDLTFLPEQAPAAEEWEDAPSDELGRIDPHLHGGDAGPAGAIAVPVEDKITYDIPVVENDAVLSWIHIYQTDLRGRFEEGLRNSGRFLPMIYEIFEEEGLPLDLAHMAHVESSYKPRAYSRAHAMGIWQFIRSTGRLYGLHRDDWVDDRANPEKATRAAARHLKDLYDEFGDWYLAMAAYNAGPGRVKSAIRRTHSRDFWKLRRSRYLRRETKNYVPAILATIIISKDPEGYGFEVEKLPPWEYEIDQVESMTDLRVVAKCAGVDLKDIKDLNPELRWLTTPPRQGSYPIRLPAGSRETFAANYADLPPEERVLWVRHRVRRGETLSVIARRYGTTVRAIQSANGIRNRHRISQNAVLMIPVGPHGQVPQRASSTRSNYQVGQKVRHRVRRGESLSTIARRYRTDVASLCAWNQLNPTSIIYAGERLTVYYGSKADAVATPGTQIAGMQRVEYRVRRGDTLTAIANRFRTSIKNLCQWNGINTRTILYPGDTLIIYSQN